VGTTALEQDMPFVGFWLYRILRSKLGVHSRAVGEDNLRKTYVQNNSQVIFQSQTTVRISCLLKR